jgi:dihydrofolate reductase
MTKKREDESKKNVVIMGRKTYLGIPESKRPLPERFNIVLTRNPNSESYPDSVIVVGSFEEALQKISSDLADQIENVWIVGGSSVYDVSLRIVQFL